jgi:flagellar hook-associated protein FlgK
MINENTQNGKVTDQGNSLVIPASLLGSVTDLLRDHVLADSKNKKIAQEAETLAIVAKIEENVTQIKDHIAKKSVSFQNVPPSKSGMTSSFPPPPFMSLENNYHNETLDNLNENLDEDESSMSTISSGSNGKIGSKSNEKKRNEPKDETLTRSITQIGPLHDRRKSRRASLPYISQAVELVSSMKFFTVSVQLLISTLIAFDVASYLFEG